MIIHEKIEKASELLSRLRPKYPDVQLGAHDRGNDIHLESLIVPKHKRKQGIGTSVMNDISNYADEKGKRMTLDPAVKGDPGETMSHSRLVRFYRRFGFNSNKGHHYDLALNSRTMMRDPVKRKK